MAWSENLQGKKVKKNAIANDNTTKISFHLVPYSLALA